MKRSKRFLEVIAVVAVMAGCSQSGDSVDATGTTEKAAASYGDDPKLDALWDACEAGDLSVCNVLYGVSEPGSAYEEFALSCGDRPGLDVPCEPTTTTTISTTTTVAVAATTAAPPPTIAGKTKETTRTTAAARQVAPPTTQAIAPPTQAPQPVAAPPPPASSGPASRYPQAPAYNGVDLDCPDIGHKVYVPPGNDPHGLDSDNDQIGCESYPG